MKESLLALAGGSLLGLSASLFLLFNGRIAGISGILASAMRPRQNTFFISVIFLLGMLLGAQVTYQLLPGLDVGALPAPSLELAIAGLLVGIGTRLGNGCTSGHGICGVGRMSYRSLIATGIFMLVAGVTVYLRLHLL